MADDCVRVSFPVHFSDPSTIRVHYSIKLRLDVRNFCEFLFFTPFI